MYSQSFTLLSDTVYERILRSKHPLPYRAFLPAFEHRIDQKMSFLGKSNPKLNFVDGFWTFCLLRLSRHSKEQVLLKKFYCKFITK